MTRVKRSAFLTLIVLITISSQSQAWFLSPCTVLSAAKSCLCKHPYATALSIGTVIATASYLAAKGYWPANLLWHNGADRVNTRRADAFKNVMGIPENEFRSLPADRQANLKRVQPDGSLDLVNQKTKQRFHAGKLELLSLGDLRRAADAKMATEGARDTGTIDVIEKSKDCTKEQSNRAVDIGELQAHHANRDAVFGVASNFNALETVSAQDNVTEKQISSYLSDRTQGPFACLSAMPGIIMRTYYYFCDGNKQNAGQWRQTQEHQINLLHGLGVEVQNGYVVEPLDTLQTKITEENADKFAIAFHSGIQVTNGYMSGNRHESFYDRRQTINQAIAAAFALNYGSPCYSGEVANTIAKRILNWTYEAILKAAYVKGKKRVILPRIGGGVFNNEQQWIDEALAAQAEFIRKSGLHVTLNNYTTVNPQTTERLKDLVKATDGDYIVYTNGGPVYRVPRELRGIIQQGIHEVISQHKNA